MKRFFCFGFLSIVLCVQAEEKKEVAITQASEPVMLPQLKIAFVDPMQFFADAAVVMDLKENAQKELKNREIRYQSLQNEIRKKGQEFQNSMNIVSPETRIEKEKELAHLQTDLQTEKKSAEEFQYMKQQEIQITVAEDMQKNVTAVAKREKFDVVLAGGLIYHNPETVVNLTDKVISESNKVYNALKNQKEQVKTLAQASNAVIKKTV